MMFMRLHVTSVFLSLILVSALALTLSASAQNIPTLADITLPAPTEPGHALIRGPHEAVDPASGQVTLRFAVPLPAEPGGWQPRFAITYSSAGAVFAGGRSTGGAFLYTQWSALASQGWNYTAPVLTFNEIQTSPNGSSDCELSTDYVLERTDGQRDSFHLSDVGDNTLNDPQDGCPQQYLSDTEADGWAATTPGVTQPGPYSTKVPTVQGPDGQKLTFAGGGEGPEFGWVPDYFYDRNGDWLHYTLNAASNNALTITDSVGRTVLTTTGFQPSTTYSSLTDTVTAAGATYTADWATGPSAAAVSITGAGSGACPAEATGIGGNSPVITSLTTPEGTYTFSYDSTYGLLKRITYPNGGYVRYVWGTTSSPSEAGVFFTPSGSGTPLPCTGVYDGVVVTDRYVSPDGTNETEHQHFAYTTTWNPSATDVWTQKTTTVTTTDTVAGTSWTKTYTYTAKGASSPANSPAWENIARIPVESDVQTVQGGNTLQDVVESWTNGFPYQLADRQVSRNNDAIGEQSFGYNASGQITDKKEYDGFVINSAPLERETTVSYASLANNILDRPSLITVYGPGSAEAAQANLAYNANGDLTSAARWVAGSSDLTTTYTNDSYGNRLTATDAGSHTTTYAYNGSTGDNAYITSITDALGHTRSYTWNDSSGTMASSTDENGNTTSYGYDSWNRLTSVTDPASLGETTFAYTPSTLETEREQSSGVWEETLDSFDGLGRVAVAATETASGAWSRTDTCYNGAGEKSFVTYAYSSSSANGPANCGEPGDSFAFDALGRQTQITHGDGTTVLTSYLGRDTETQDEGNGTSRVTRIAETDGLGRLADICEVVGSHGPTEGPGAAQCGLEMAGNGYLTTYAYDALDDLTSIAPGWGKPHVRLRRPRAIDGFDHARRRHDRL
ncbi:MAG: hypothetical protein EPN33_00010 [Acidobacteria bacterium]|nr:MAG: hypothetical protein EPN33_00010 [Acidobacteriota bacterium]